MRYAGVVIAVLALASLIALWTVPRWLVPLLPARFPGCIYAVETTASAVALTIDDGPDSSTTGELLRQLHNNDAHATFFLIAGHVASNDSLVTELTKRGHEIGNHLTRDESSISLSPQAFDSALVSAGRILSGYAPVRWARPGGGRYNQRMVETIQQRGYQCALGSVYPYDAEIPSSRFSTAFILAHARPGAIIVLHDRGARGRRTAAVLKRVLPELRRRGLRVVTLAELTSLASPHAWYRRVRTIDLTGDGRGDSVRLEAVGARPDSLRITLSLLVNGQERHRESWGSSYELDLLDSAARADPRVDAVVRAKLDGVLASVVVQRLDAPGVMAEDSAVLARLDSRPTHRISFSYGYETTTRLVWDSPRKRFVRLWSCC